MNHLMFVRAMLDEHEDDTPRLVFADWLEEQGDEARAAWVRANCRLGRTHYNDPAFRDVVLGEREAFKRCRPAWWEEIKGVSQRSDRGIFRFEVRSRTALTRLGKVPWLEKALAGGWLEGISIGWCDGSQARVVAGWKGPVQEVPLFVTVAPQVSDEGLSIYLQVPHLWGLTLPAYAQVNPAVKRLRRRSDLRELKLEGLLDRTDLKKADPSGLLRQVGQLTGLQRLVIQGSKHPTDDDLRWLATLTGLRQLLLDGCTTVTESGLAHLEGLNGLKELKLWSCAGVTEAGIAKLRRGLPNLRVESL